MAGISKRFVAILPLLVLASGCSDNRAGGAREDDAQNKRVTTSEFDRPMAGDAFGSEDMDDPRPQSLPRSFLTVNGKKITVEVADTERRRQKGYMYRQGIPDGCGMIFLYPEVQKDGAKYWNHNVPIDLDVAFADRDGRIVAVVTLLARDQTPKGTDKAVFSVLEMAGGSFAKLGIKLNDKFEFSPALAAHRAK